MKIYEPIETAMKNGSAVVQQTEGATEGANYDEDAFVLALGSGNLPSIFQGLSDALARRVDVDSYHHDDGAGGGGPYGTYRGQPEPRMGSAYRRAQPRRVTAHRANGTADQSLRGKRFTMSDTVTSMIVG